MFKFIKKFTKSLKVKFIVFNFITILFIIIMSIIYSIYQFNDTTKKNLHETLMSQARAAELMLTEKVEYLDRINESIVKDNAVIMPLKLEIDNQVVNYFSQINQEYKEIDDVIVANTEKVLYKSTDKYLNLLEEIRLKAQESELVNIRASGIVDIQGMSIISVRLVYSGRTVEDKVLVGFVLVAHDLSKDFNFVSTMGRKLETNIALYQKNKMLVMANNKGKTFKPSKNGETIDTTQVFKKGMYFPDGTKDLFGKNYFIYLQAIKDINNKPVGVIATAQPSDKYYSSLTTIVISLAVIGLVGLGIGFILILVISSILIKPISSLTKCSQIVQTGDLTVEAQCKSNDEISILSSGFNDMVKNLRNIVKTIIGKSNIISEISENLSQSYMQINSHMIQIDKSIGGLNKNFIQNSENINSINSGIEEITENLQEIVGYSNGTRNNSKNSVNKAFKVMSKVEDAKTSSKEVVGETQKLVDLTDELENMSQRIESFVSIIAEIANQTNLLALNAAIEAARAGEHGSGFSIIAKEIGSLAVLTRNQTESISVLNNDIIQKVKDVANKMTSNLDKVESSFEIVVELGNVLEDLTNFIKNLDNDMDQFVGLAENQAACSEQISSSMDTIANNSNDMTRSVSEITNVVADEKMLVENTLNNIQSLQQAFEELKQLVNSFKV